VEFWFSDQARIDDIMAVFVSPTQVWVIEQEQPAHTV
jgi:hypothetical protein